MIETELIRQSTDPLPDELHGISLRGTPQTQLKFAKTKPFLKEQASKRPALAR